MIKDKLLIYKDSASLSEAFTRFLIEEVLNEDNKISLALSGGSTPKVIFDYWSEKYSDDLPWNNINMFWGDERCVSPDDEMSNYRMTKEYLLDKVAIPQSNIFRIYGEDDPEKEAIRYSDILDSQLSSVNGVPEFDLVILGLGEDGHTASIFPYQMKLWDSERNCVVAAHPETKMKRISITGKIIDNAKKVVILSTGKGKAEKVRDITQHRNLFVDKYPAAKISPKNRNLYWFLDESAASLL